MCTKDEVRDVIDTEVPDIVNAELGAFLKKKLWMLIISVFVMGGSWGVLAYQVKGNTDARTVGDRYTQEEHDVFEADIRRDLGNLRTDVKDDISEIKDDIRFIREKLGG